MASRNIYSSQQIQKKKPTAAQMYPHSRESSGIPYLVSQLNQQSLTSIRPNGTIPSYRGSRMGTEQSMTSGQQSGYQSTGPKPTQEGRANRNINTSQPRTSPQHRNQGRRQNQKHEGFYQGVLNQRNAESQFMKPQQPLLNNQGFGSPYGASRTTIDYNQSMRAEQAQFQSNNPQPFSPYGRQNQSLPFQQDQPSLNYGSMSPDSRNPFVRNTGSAQSNIMKLYSSLVSTLKHSESMQGLCCHLLKQVNTVMQGRTCVSPEQEANALKGFQDLLEATKAATYGKSGSQKAQEDKPCDTGEEAQALMDYAGEMMQITGVQSVFTLDELFDQDQEALTRHLAEVFQTAVLDSTCLKWSRLGWDQQTNINWKLTEAEKQSSVRQVSSIIKSTEIKIEKIMIASRIAGQQEGALTEFSQKLLRLEAENKQLRRELVTKKSPISLINLDRTQSPFSGHSRSVSPSPERSASKSNNPNLKEQFNALLQDNECLNENNIKQEKAIRSYESAIKVMIDQQKQVKIEHKIKTDLVERFQKQMQADHRNEMQDLLSQNNLSARSAPKNQTSEAGLQVDLLHQYANMVALDSKALEDDNLNFREQIVFLEGQVADLEAQISESKRRQTLFQKQMNKQFDKEKVDLIASHAREIETLQIDTQEKILIEKNTFEQASERKLREQENLNEKMKTVLELQIESSQLQVRKGELDLKRQQDQLDFNSKHIAQSNGANSARTSLEQDKLIFDLTQSKTKEEKRAKDLEFQLKYLTEEFDQKQEKISELELNSFDIQELKAQYSDLEKERESLHQELASQIRSQRNTISEQEIEESISLQSELKSKNEELESKQEELQELSKRYRDLENKMILSDKIKSVMEKKLEDSVREKFTMAQKDQAKIEFEASASRDARQLLDFATEKAVLEHAKDGLQQKLLELTQFKCQNSQNSQYEVKQLQGQAATLTQQLKDKDRLLQILQNKLAVSQAVQKQHDKLEQDLEFERFQRAGTDARSLLDNTIEKAIDQQNKDILNQKIADLTLQIYEAEKRAKLHQKVDQPMMISQKAGNNTQKEKLQGILLQKADDKTKNLESANRDLHKALHDAKNQADQTLNERESKVKKLQAEIQDLLASNYVSNLVSVKEIDTGVQLAQDKSSSNLVQANLTIKTLDEELQQLKTHVSTLQAGSTVDADARDSANVEAIEMRDDQIKQLDNDCDRLKIDQTKKGQAIDELTKQVQIALQAKTVNDLRLEAQLKEQKGSEEIREQAEVDATRNAEAIREKDGKILELQEEFSALKESQQAKLDQIVSSMQAGLCFTQVTEKEEQLHRSEAQLVELQESITQHKAQNDRKDGQLQDLHSEVKRHETDNLDKAKQIESLKLEVDVQLRKDQENLATIKELEEKGGQSPASESKEKELQEQIDELTIEKEELQEEIDNTNEEMEYLKEDVQAAKDAEGKLTSQLAEYSSVKQELQICQNELDEIKNTNETLIFQVSELNFEKRRLGQENVQLEAEIEQILAKGTQVAEVLPVEEETEALMPEHNHPFLPGMDELTSIDTLCCAKPEIEKPRDTVAVALDNSGLLGKLVRRATIVRQEEEASALSQQIAETPIVESDEYESEQDTSSDDESNHVSKSRLLFKEAFQEYDSRPQILSDSPLSSEDSFLARYPLGSPGFIQQPTVVQKSVPRDTFDTAMDNTGMFGAMIRRSSVLYADQLQDLQKQPLKEPQPIGEADEYESEDNSDSSSATGSAKSQSSLKLPTPPQSPLAQAINNTQQDQEHHLKVFQASVRGICDLEKTYGKEDVIKKSTPNPDVCAKIQLFVESRYVADPLLAQTVIKNNPEKAKPAAELPRNSVDIEFSEQYLPDFQQKLQYGMRKKIIAFYQQDQEAQKAEEEKVRQTMLQKNKPPPRKSIQFDLMGANKKRASLMGNLKSFGPPPKVKQKVEKEPFVIDSSSDSIVPERTSQPPVFLELEESESDASKSLIETKEEPVKDPMDKAMTNTGLLGAMIRRSSLLNPNEIILLQKVKATPVGEDDYEDEDDSSDDTGSEPSRKSSNKQMPADLPIFDLEQLGELTAQQVEADQPETKIDKAINNSGILGNIARRSSILNPSMQMPILTPVKKTEPHCEGDYCSEDDSSAGREGEDPNSYSDS